MASRMGINLPNAPIAEPCFLDLDAFERDLAAFAAIPGIEDYASDAPLLRHLVRRANRVALLGG